MMDIHRKVVVVILCAVLLSYEFSTAENPVTKGQYEMIIKPLQGASNGDTHTEAVILPGSTVKVILDMKNVQNPSFVIFQVHSFVEPLVLSSAVSSEIHNSVNGTDIGLYTKLIPMTANGTVLYFISNPSSKTVDFMVLPIFYSSGDPIPGGCNLSFLVNIAPFMSLTYNHTNGIVQVDAQASSAQTDGDCQPNELGYEVYELYTKDTSAAAYFDTIRSIITPDKAANLGLKSPKPIDQPALRRRFAAYPMFGSVYVVTVRNLKTGKSSAYVPISNFNCIHGIGDGCAFFSVITTVVWLSVPAVVMCILAECRCLLGIGVSYMMKLYFIVTILVTLTPILPQYLGQLMMFSISAGLPIVTSQVNEESPGWFSFLVTSYRSMTEVLFPLVPAYIFSIFFIAPLMYWMSTLQNQFTIILLYIFLYLFFLCASKIISDHGLEVWCGHFYAALLFSYTTNGVLAHLFADPARILQSGMSDVMFYLPASQFDLIIVSLWVFLTMIDAPGRKFIRASTSGENRLIINDSPQASRRYGSA